MFSRNKLNLPLLSTRYQTRPLESKTTHAHCTYMSFWNGSCAKDRKRRINGDTCRGIYLSASLLILLYIFIIFYRCCQQYGNIHPYEFYSVRNVNCIHNALLHTICMENYNLLTRLHFIQLNNFRCPFVDRATTTHRYALCSFFF